MSALDQLVQINISQQTQAIPQPSFSIPAIFGSSNRFAAAMTTGNTTSGSAVLTNIANLTGVVPGAYVSGAGIPAGNFIQTVNGNTATMGNAYRSPNATATASGVSLSVKDAIRTYTSTAAMTTDGFLSSDPEFVQATELLEQPLVPTQFKVGSISASVAQVDTIAVSTLVATGHLYTFTINGVVVSYTSNSDTQQSILTALLAALNAAFPSGAPVTGVVTGTGSGALLTLTSVTPGVPVLYTAVDVDLTQANLTLNHTTTTDIAQAQLQDDTWYGLAVCTHTDWDITQIAAFIEGLLKIFIGATATAAVATTATTDVGSVLKGKSYKRTALIFTNEPNEGKESAWLGGQLPAVPGSNNWAFKTLFGATPDVLTPSQQTALIGDPVAALPGKNVNIYQTVGGVPITEMGTMAGGQFIDITVGIDWLQSTLKTNIFAALAQASKIPYTDKGVGILISAVRAAIDQGVTNGLIDGASPISVTAPPVLSVPQNQRASRVAPTISFSCRLAGAFNAVVVAGTVTV